MTYHFIMSVQNIQTMDSFGGDKFRYKNETKTDA